ncbi:hypothetical protein NQD34_007838 [Periophthalmus magnuspinnatus]|nr:hypothetical protein NQD34_007838 [Periophthalmus magnuspinnatus]
MDRTSTAVFERTIRTLRTLFLMIYYLIEEKSRCRRHSHFCLFRLNINRQIVTVPALLSLCPRLPPSLTCLSPELGGIRTPPTRTCSPSAQSTPPAVDKRGSDESLGAGTSAGFTSPPQNQLRTSPAPAPPPWYVLCLHCRALCLSALTDPHPRSPATLD